MLKQYSAACARITYETEFKYAYACIVVEKAIYQAQSLKQTNKNKNVSLIESE